MNRQNKILSNTFYWQSGCLFIPIADFILFSMNIAVRQDMAVEQISLSCNPISIPMKKSEATGSFEAQLQKLISNY